jgi:WD40 repeat protein
VARPNLVRFSPDGRELLAETGDRTLRIFDVLNGRLLRDLGQHRDFITGACWSPDGRTVASKDSSGILNFWHTASGQLLVALEFAHFGGLGGMKFSTDGKWLANHTANNEVHLLPMQP